MPFINPDDPTREIYQFDNGKELVCIDPSVAWRTINSACIKPTVDGLPGETWAELCRRWAACVPSENDTIDTSIAKLADFRIVQGKLATVAYEVFDLQPVAKDGSGVPENFAVNVLMEFIGAREKKEPSTVISPSESPPTVSAPATSSSVPTSAAGRGRRSMNTGARSMRPTSTG
jgi:hypothetical protein